MSQVSTSSEVPSPVCLTTRLTPSGRGAVAVICVEGENAVARVAQYFVSATRKPLASFPVNRVVFGRWAQSDGHGEELVVCRTSETSVEVNCHGGAAAARAIMKSLVADGAVEQVSSRWVNRRTSDSIQAEAWLALTEARTERTAAILLDQYRGALRKAIRDAIVQLQNGDSTKARCELATLLQRGDIGMHLTRPWRVAFAGPPNVGKSSLMNRLLGYERSIVFDQPGTTRDLLSAPTAFDGWSMELTDTAGLRDSEDTIEVEGVSRATKFLAEADLTVLVFDTTTGWDERQEQLAERHPNALLVANKCDLHGVRESAKPFLATSALTGEGVRELMQQIVERLVRSEMMPGDAVPFTSRQIHAIAAACQAVDDGELSFAIEELQTLIADLLTSTHETPIE
ncbi:MAG: 50S ribosome-binding GTPase [Planctomycetaceae bacterium]|nr:50S ribosome-binding GTPase [Planctomycetaceae bacterium]